MAEKKPNILIIWGDDIGWFNVSAYNHGIMGYRTPNIDRIAKEGCMFTDWYGQQSCTAGRAAFITGQSPIRTGLTKVGLPGADLGLRPEDPTIADVLKPLGYVCGQFGKNHLGDRNEFLPTVHGFDEFFGNLYHLNAEQEPENPDYPKDPKFKEKFGPRGVLHTWATDQDDATDDPIYGRVGKQKIENTGPLTIKRMETVDEEFLDAARGTGNTDGRHAGANRQLPHDESGASRGAARLRIVIGEQHAVLGDAVDAGCVSHHAVRVGADVPHADIVTEDDDDVGFLALREDRHCCGQQHGQDSTGERVSTSHDFLP